MLRVMKGDCREVLPNLPANSVQTCITSPPYHQLRDASGVAGELGQERTPERYPVFELVPTRGQPNQ